MAPTACPLFAGLLARSTGRLLKSEDCSRGNFLSRALPLTWKRQLSPTATAVHSPDRPWERPVSVNPRRVENAPSSKPGSSYHCTGRSEEHTSELQSRLHLVCRLLLEKKNRLV